MGLLSGQKPSTGRFAQEAVVMAMAYGFCYKKVELLRAMAKILWTFITLLTIHAFPSLFAGEVQSAEGQHFRTFI